MNRSPKNCCPCVNFGPSLWTAPALWRFGLKAAEGSQRPQRRLAMLHELNIPVSQAVVPIRDRFAAFPELAGWDIAALGGHDVRHGTHGPAAATASGGQEVPGTVTGVFLRDLRSGAARVLAQTQGHQHECAAVKGGAACLS